MATQHADMTEERWSRFPFDQQVLMIANELHRASRRCSAGDREGLRLGYERVFALLDVTVAVADRRSVRRELLRFREMLAERYLAPPDLAAHLALLRAFLQLSPGAHAQIPYLIPTGIRGGP